MTTITINTNLNNWSGEEATVEAYLNKNGDLQFSFYGYEFELSAPVWFDESIAARELNGSDWSDKLVTLTLNSASPEKALKQAVQWIANYV